MARDNLTNGGVSDAAISVNLGTGAILSATNAQIVVVNNTDATVRGTISVPANINVAERGVGVDHGFVLQPFSYEISQVTKNATAAGAASTISIASGGVGTTHRTSAQTGEFVYMARIDN